MFSKSKLHVYSFTLLGLTGLLILGVWASNDLIMGPAFSHSDQKINGISLVSSRELIDSADIAPIKSINANWVSIIPYGFLRKGTSEILFNQRRQWYGERKQGIMEMVKLCHDQGLKVMLKPQVWMNRGGFTGDFDPGNPILWMEFESSYRNYILQFAHVADSMKVELFCIGTEWRLFIEERPDFWDSLIEEVRQAYKGDLVYAANWDEYDEVPFWGNLDYIGVNAYMPLDTARVSEGTKLQNAWQLVFEDMNAVSARFKKPILLTEFGYRSVEYTAKKPWQSTDTRKISMEAQSIALDALFTSLWDKPTIAGGFLWKWYHNHDRHGGVENAGYTPQNKPAEKIIKKYYGKRQ